MVDNSALSSDLAAVRLDPNFLAGISAVDAFLPNTSINNIQIQPINDKSLAEKLFTLDASSAIISSEASTGNLALADPSVLVASASSFRISYTDLSGVARVYNFSLLPAIEVRGSPNAGGQVPDIKPGILIKTSMNIKRFAVPGGPPVFQTLGIEQTIIQLVGLFIGNEGASPSSVEDVYSPTVTLNSQQTSTMFDRELVQLGRPVDLYITTGRGGDQGIKLSYKLLLQGMRYFVTRSDRTYYALEGIILDYKQYGIKTNQTVASQPIATPNPFGTPIDPTQLNFSGATIPTTNSLSPAQITQSAGNPITLDLNNVPANQLSTRGGKASDLPTTAGGAQ